MSITKEVNLETFVPELKLNYTFSVELIDDIIVSKAIMGETSISREQANEIFIEIVQSQIKNDLLEILK